MKVTITKVYMQDGKQVGYEVKQEDGQVIDINKSDINGLSNYEKVNFTISDTGLVRVDKNVPRETITRQSTKYVIPASEVINNLKAEINNLKAEISSLKTELSERDNEINTLRSQIKNNSSSSRLDRLLGVYLDEYL